MIMAWLKKESEKKKHTMPQELSSDLTLKLQQTVKQGQCSPSDTPNPTEEALVLTYLNGMIERQQLFIKPKLRGKDYDVYNYDNLFVRITVRLKWRETNYNNKFTRFFSPKRSSSRLCILTTLWILVTISGSPGFHEKLFFYTHVKGTVKEKTLDFPKMQCLFMSYH